MSKQFRAIFFTLAFSLSSLLTASEPSFFSLPREDGSLIEGYASQPDSSLSFPIIIAIQGSTCESAFDWFLKLKEHADDFGYGLIVLEKQGISKDAIHPYEYAHNNSIDQRIDDYFLCLNNLNNSIIPGWNGEIVLWGESEGGIIAGELSSKIANLKAVMLFATGGGMQVVDEVKQAIQRKLEGKGLSEFEIVQFLSEFEDKTIEMLNDPSPDKKFLGNTYKWWSSLFSSKSILSSLQDTRIPTYMVHGKKDEQIPIESADLIAQELNHQGKNILTYNKLGGYGHNLKHPLLIQNALLWLDSLENKEIVPYENKIALPNAISFEEILSEDTSSILKIEVFELSLDRGGGYSGYAGGSRDSEGNKEAHAGIEVNVHSENGWHAELDASVRRNEDKDGNTKTEARGEGRVGRSWFKL